MQVVRQRFTVFGQCFPPELVSPQRKRHTADTLRRAKWLLPKVLEYVPAYGPSVVCLIEPVVRQRLLLPTVTMLARGETMPNLRGIVQQLKTQRDRAQKEVERLNAAQSGRRFDTSPQRQEPESSISSCTQENCRSSAGSVGEVEGCTARQMSGFGSCFPQFHSQIFCFYAENRVDTNQTTIYFVSRRRLKGLAK